MELRNGLRELATFAERWRLAIGDFAHLRSIPLDYMHQKLPTRFYRAKFWVKFVLWRGAVRCGVFGEVFARSFWRSFRACFAGTFRAAKPSAKTSAQNSHVSAQQNWRKSREKLHDKVLQGVPCQIKRSWNLSDPII